MSRVGWEDVRLVLKIKPESVLFSRPVTHGLTESDAWCTVMLNQKAVTAHLKSEQLLPFGLARLVQETTRQ